MTDSTQRFLTRVRYRVRAYNWRAFGTLALLLLSSALLLIVVLAWQLPYGSGLFVEPGEVAGFNVVAPQRITFESAVQTERLRERAAQAVADQYDTQETRLRRQQFNRAREVVEMIDSVRKKDDATLAAKSDLLLAIEDLDLSAESVLQILSLDGPQWEAVATETPLAVDRAMRDEIRESTLPLIQRRVPMLIGGALDEAANDVAISLVQGLIRPNSVLNAERTKQLRDEARAQVLTQTVTLEQGEMIIRAGDVASPEQTEALREMSMLQYEWDLWALLQAGLFSVTLLIVVIGSLYRLYPQVLHSYSQLGLLLVVTVLWLLAAKFMVVNHPWLPFLYPMGALVILIGVLCDLRVAVVFALAFAMILLYLSLGNAPLVAYALLGSLAGSLIVGRGERLNTFLWAALAIGLVNAVMVAAFWVPFTGAGTPSPVAMALIAGLNGVLSAAIALIGYFVLGNLFDITTPLQLAELSRPTHPLLRQLLLKASGTYHHTILVSNMAERAAAAIGADALLVRVGAYYHDIGKTVRPYFFAENIVDGSSPHEKLDPLTSAQIIISHVKDGIDLAQKYRLPTRIQDFIREHHGQSLVKYFYLQALRHAATGEEIDEAEFRYPGPNPQSKETTILMLADTCEAAVRAVRPATREDLEALVDRLIDERVASGELENSNLTFAELQTVKNVFLQVLQGVHHPRIVYPEAVKAGETTSTAATVEDVASAPPERTARGGIEEAATGRPPLSAPVNMAAEG